MARRYIRRAPVVSQLGPLRRAIQAQLGQSNVAQQWPNRRPRTIPQQAYGARASTPIPDGYGATTVAGGTATVYVGPSGVGTIWYPTMAVLATTSGATDSSTAVIYLTPLTNGSFHVQTQIGGQSYAGGGDTIGLAVPPMWPGTYIAAVWSGANNGDLASLTVYGDRDVLA